MFTSTIYRICRRMKIVLTRPVDKRHWIFVQLSMIHSDYKLLFTLLNIIIELTASIFFLLTILYIKKHINVSPMNISRKLII